MTSVDKNKQKSHNKNTQNPHNKNKYHTGCGAAELKWLCLFQFLPVTVTHA